MQFKLEDAISLSRHNLTATLTAGGTNLGTIGIDNGVLSFENGDEDWQHFSLKEVTPDVVASNFPAYTSDEPFFATGLTIGKKWVIRAQYALEAYSLGKHITFGLKFLVAANGKVFVNYFMIDDNLGGLVRDFWYEATRL